MLEHAAMLFDEATPADKLHLNWSLLSTRGLRDQLNIEGVEVRRKHVGTLIRTLRISSQHGKPRTSAQGPQRSRLFSLPTGKSRDRLPKVTDARARMRGETKSALFPKET